MPGIIFSKVISGGQTGVDRAALDVALKLGIPCGGWCPKGRKAEDGPIAPKYPLKEAKSAQYQFRTEANVMEADGTLIVAEERALLNAKRNAIEQAGTYIESYSKVENFKLTHDEIHVIAAGLMQVSIIDKKRIILENGFRIWVKIKAKVSTGKTEEFGS